MKKQKVFYSVIGVFLVFLAVVFVSGCQNVANKELKEIRITSTLKDTYYIGEEIDFSLATFDVEYISGEVVSVTMQDDRMYSNYTEVNNQTAGDKTVIFIYRLNSFDAVYVNFVVHIIEDSVTIISLDKTSFSSVVKQNDTLDLTGIKAQVTFASGKSEDLTSTYDQYEIYDSVTGDKIDLSIAKI